MKRTITGAALAAALVVTGCGSNDATEPVPPAQVVPEGSAEQEPAARSAEPTPDKLWGRQFIE